MWNTVKPLFSKSSGGSRKVTLVENDQIISDDQKIVNTFNTFFDEAVSSSDIRINPSVLNDTGEPENPVDIALKKFESHPNILALKDNAEKLPTFAFNEGNLEDMMSKSKK